MAVDNGNQILAIKYCIAIIAIYFAIATFYLVKLWHFKKLQLLQYFFERV
jgi:hypothetical protein